MPSATPKSSPSRGELGWTFAGTLPPTNSREVVFTARIVGQAGGTVIENTALVFFKQGAIQRSGVSNKARLSVIADLPDSAVVRANSVASTPSWFSSDAGGTLDMDWADLDNDGDLDLALASTLGTYVYRNDGGLLKLLWSDPQRRTVFGVRWLDADNDGVPELVAVGTPLGDTGGANYVFRYNAGTLQSPDRFQVASNGLFTTTAQLTRIETGHFDSDTLPDLLVSVNAISAECPVYLLLNQGANLFRGAPKCVSEAGSAALSAADMNRDGYLDVALGLFPNQFRVFLGANGVLTQTNPSENTVFVDAPSYFLPYDFTWGDIDRDGDLDLAAAFPLQRQVRIYRNLTDPTVSGVVAAANDPSFQLIQTLNTSVFLTPYAIEFGDMDRDGALDLIVADANPIIYWNTIDPAQPYSNLPALHTEINLPGTQRTEIWAVRAIDQDGDGTLELAIANRDGPSLLLANFSPALNSALTPVGASGAAGSVAWSDADDDGLNDLLLGASSNRNTSRLFYNVNGAFSLDDATLYDADSIGVQTVLPGDLDADLIGSADGGQLDLFLVTPSGVRLSRNQGGLTPIAIPGLDDSGHAAALGDADGDGDLDLVVAPAGGPLYLVENRAGQVPNLLVREIAGSPIGATALAWGDLNSDHYLDLAVATASGIRILLNNSDLTFTETSVSAAAARCGRPAGGPAFLTRALAWGDLDADGHLDLAVANSPGPGCVLLNTNGSLTFFQQISEGLAASTLDRGDWDNDGDLDLAVGHRNAPVRVYANIGGRLVYLWQSAQNYDATNLRFGDMDADGDLDLALAQDREGVDSGIFENRTVAPAHFLSAAQVQALPNQSAYVHVRRPGTTRSAYAYSSSELLAGPTVPTVTVSYRIFDPDGIASDPPTQLNVLYAFSMDGGGRWDEATPMVDTDGVVTATLSRTGVDQTFLWNAVADGAIGERALFRVSVVNPNDGNLVQRAVGAGVSPPFEVRGTTCIWPDDPTIFINNVKTQDGSTYAIPAGSAAVSLEFAATLGKGSGVMQFQWDLDDGRGLRTAQRMTQNFRNGSYTIQLVASGEACPVRRVVRNRVTIKVGTGVADTFLSMINVKPQTATVASAVAADLEVGGGAEPALPSAPRAFTATATSGKVAMRWNGGSPDLETLVYMSSPGSAEAAVVARLSGVATGYEGPIVCGATYWIVFTGAGGESDAGAVWIAPPCDEEVAP